MIPRQASVLVCDDLLVALNGKFTMLGMYTADIVIPTDPSISGQLVFLFVVETDIKDPFRSVTLQVALPESAPTRFQIPIMPPLDVHPDRERLIVRWPLVVSPAILKPGKIEAKVIHETGEINAAAPWVLLASAPPAPEVRH